MEIIITILSALGGGLIGGLVAFFIIVYVREKN